jgi:hypothetical protein
MPKVKKRCEKGAQSFHSSLSLSLTHARTHTHTHTCLRMGLMSPKLGCLSTSWHQVEICRENREREKRREVS